MKLCDSIHKNMPMDFKEKLGELPALALGYRSNHRFVPVRQELVFYNGQKIRNRNFLA